MNTIERGLAAFIDSLRPDELMITAHIHDQPARLRSIAEPPPIAMMQSAGIRMADSPSELGTTLLAVLNG